MTTLDPTAPLTRPDYRRRARILWRVAQIAVDRAKEAEAALSEERALRVVVEEREARLAERIQQLEAQLAYTKYCAA